MKRRFDYNRIGKRRWYLVALLAGPVLCAVPCVVLLLFQIPLGPSLAPAIALPAAFLLFFLMAAGEEVGWMGYAFEPMQSRFGALRASLLFGTVWVLWHVPFFVYVMPDPVVFGTQIFILIANRVLMTWVFNNTGKSVFAVILFHAADNAALVTLPEIYAVKPWGAIVHCVAVVIAAIVVTFLWGHTTLARYRFGN